MTPEQRASLTLFGSPDLDFPESQGHELFFEPNANGRLISWNDLVARYRSERREARRLYLAAPFGHREKMEAHADRLKVAGFEITSGWVYGGEDGLTLEQIAVMDLEHVDAADTVVSFTFPRGTLTSGGGRHVEFGYALAKGKRLVLIGPQENVFHHMPGVESYETLDAWLASIPERVT